jgi:hypothetical protein
MRQRCSGCCPVEKCTSFEDKLTQRIRKIPTLLCAQSSPRTTLGSGITVVAGSNHGRGMNVFLSAVVFSSDNSTMV